MIHVHGLEIGDDPEGHPGHCLEENPEDSILLRGTVQSMKGRDPSPHPKVAGSFDHPLDSINTEG
jgi:hypothetical protein